MAGPTSVLKPPLAEEIPRDAPLRLPRLTPRKRNPSAPNTVPTPPAPVLLEPPNTREWRFQTPSRRILSPADEQIFQNAATRDLILAFVFSLSDSVRDLKVSSVSNMKQDPTISRLLGILDSVEETLKFWEPVDQAGSRFGNPVFRDFLDTVASQCPGWHESLGIKSPSAAAELSAYFQNSFGNRTRIDYGSGHELNFIMWLLCLNRLSLLPPSLFAPAILLVFFRYIRLLRSIQGTYYLEPAGSHGVWGLDDYQFLPFLFGASQLLHHPYIRPLSIHNEIILEEEGDEYIYLDMIRFTMASKTVKGLKWTQPMLDDISGAKSWEKVEQGMRKMFVKEVLGKLPVMQHFLFGSLIPAVEGMSCEEGQQGKLEGSEDGVEVGGAHANGAPHVHRDDEWGDCCGIKIPSTVAAAAEAKKSGQQDTFRRIPFD